MNTAYEFYDPFRRTLFSSFYQFVKATDHFVLRINANRYHKSYSLMKPGSLAKIYYV